MRAQDRPAESVTEVMRFVVPVDRLAANTRRSPAVVGAANLAVNVVVPVVSVAPAACTSCGPVVVAATCDPADARKVGSPPSVRTTPAVKTSLRVRTIASRRLAERCGPPLPRQQMLFTAHPADSMHTEEAASGICPIADFRPCVGGSSAAPCPQGPVHGGRRQPRPTLLAGPGCAEHEGSAPARGSGWEHPAQAERARRLCARVLMAFVATLGLSAALSAALPAATASAATGSYRHVFLIVGENKSLFRLNAHNAPYIMTSLKPKAAWYTDYNDVTTGLLANYIALTTGEFAPCEAHGPCGRHKVASIFSQLGNGGWRDWNESMPANCYRRSTGSMSGLNAYKVGHNPVLYLAGLPCATYDVPAGTTGPDNMSAFNKALSAGTVPRFNFVSPNLCEDSYHQCTSENIVTEYDNFRKGRFRTSKRHRRSGRTGHFRDLRRRQRGSEGPEHDDARPRVRRAGRNVSRSFHPLLDVGDGGAWPLGLPCLAHACAATALAGT